MNGSGFVLFLCGFFGVCSMSRGRGPFSLPAPWNNEHVLRIAKCPMIWP